MTSLELLQSLEKLALVQRPNFVLLQMFDIDRHSDTMSVSVQRLKLLHIEEDSFESSDSIVGSFW